MSRKKANFWKSLKENGAWSRASVIRRADRDARLKAQGRGPGVISEDRRWHSLEPVCAKGAKVVLTMDYAEAARMLESIESARTFVAGLAYRERDEPDGSLEESRRLFDEVRSLDASAHRIRRALESVEHRAKRADEARRRSSYKASRRAAPLEQQEELQ